MKANFRTCPQCSTRNRLDKEFCVKCGEPLEGIKVGDQSAAAPVKGKPGIVLSETEEGQSPLVPFVVVLLVLGVAFAAWRSVSLAPPPEVPQSTARPQSVPLAKSTTPLPLPAGAKEYNDGLALLRAGDLPGAISQFRLAIAAANKAEYRAALADALEKSGATSEALTEYESAYNLESNVPRYASDWAKALNRAGRINDSIKAYEKALAIDGENLNNLREVINLYGRSSTPALARPHLERLVALQPDDLLPRQSLAKVLEQSNDLPAAIVQYQSILAAMPSADLSRALLSEVFMQQNRSDDALRLLDDGLKANPSAALLYREKGRILDRLGRDGEAVVAYREYVRLAPGASDVRIFSTRIEQLAGT